MRFGRVMGHGNRKCIIMIESWEREENQKLLPEVSDGGLQTWIMFQFIWKMCVPDILGYCAPGKQRRQARGDSEVWQRTGGQMSSRLPPCDRLCHPISPAPHQTLLPPRPPPMQRHRQCWTGLPSWSPLRACTPVAWCSLRVVGLVGKKIMVQRTFLDLFLQARMSISQGTYIGVSGQEYFSEAFRG